MPDNPAFDWRLGEQRENRRESCADESAVNCQRFPEEVQTRRVDATGIRHSIRLFRERVIPELRCAAGNIEVILRRSAVSVMHSGADGDCRC